MGCDSCHMAPSSSRFQMESSPIMRLRARTSGSVETSGASGFSCTSLPKRGAGEAAYQLWIWLTAQGRMNNSSHVSTWGILLRVVYVGNRSRMLTWTSSSIGWACQVLLDLGAIQEQIASSACRSLVTPYRVDVATANPLTERGVAPVISSRGGRQVDQSVRQFVVDGQFLSVGCHVQAVVTPAPEAAFACGASRGNHWSGRGDSNPRPLPWQGSALPLSYSRSTATCEGLGIVVPRVRIELTTPAFSALCSTN